MLIIDGHNLIPKVPGMSLEDIDDEEKLAALLQAYARVKRKEVVVFFDGAPLGYAGLRMFGTVRAYFVPAHRTADDAIRQYLSTMGKAARAATVVSSDRVVQANARELHARVRPSEDFAAELAALHASPAAPGSSQAARAKPPAADAAKLPEDKVAEWADLFGLDPEHIDRPIDLSKRPAKKRPSKTAPGNAVESEQATQKKRKYHGFQKKS